LLLVGAAALYWAALSKSEWFSFSHRVDSNLLPPRVVLFTSLSTGDRAEAPAFSPDGNQVAFVRRSDSPGVSGIYIKQIGSEHLLQLTKNEHEQDWFCCPAWSPDGRYIAFSRYPHNGNTVNQTINIVSAIGGAERKLLSQAPAHPPLDWSPDGKFIAFTAKDVDRETYSVFLLSIENLEIRRLSNPPAEYQDSGPAFSPDGKQLAFIRANGEVGDIFIMAANGGEPRRLTFDHASIPSPPAWTRDGQSIVFSSNRNRIPTLWRIPASGGEPVQVPQVGAGTVHPSVAPKGYRLAYEQMTGASSIWVAELAKIDSKIPRMKVTASKGQNEAPELSPDGKKIVFESDRLGSMEIWTCDRDGSSLNQLTHLGGPQSLGPPRWSPDSQRIAFDSTLGEHNAIFVINAEGGVPRQLTHEATGSRNPTWSRDGKWIYFSSIRTGEWQIWRMPSEGGDPVQLTKHGGQVAFESADRRFIYYWKMPDAGIWRMGIDGGQETPLAPQVHPRSWGDWALVDRGIFVLSEGTAGRSVMRFFDFATTRVKDVVFLAQPVGANSWISASADGEFVLYRQDDQDESNILLLENFR
jgi:Tol biopolymer transport system component